MACFAARICAFALLGYERLAVGDWQRLARWNGVTRSYTAEEVVRLRNSFAVRHTLAERGAERLWRLLTEEDFVPALGALTGGLDAGHGEIRRAVGPGAAALVPVADRLLRFPLS